MREIRETTSVENMTILSENVEERNRKLIQMNRNDKNVTNQNLEN